MDCIFVLENHLTQDLTSPQVYSRSLTFALGCYTLARWVVGRYPQVTRSRVNHLNGARQAVVVRVRVLTSFFLSLPIPSAKLLPSAPTGTR